LIFIHVIAANCTDHNRSLFCVRQANISVVRRIKKTDSNRLARATGATVVNRTDELRDEDIGTRATLFEVTKVKRAILHKKFRFSKA
jgi:chaperonin GroEL (HSP60 family)